MDQQNLSHHLKLVPNAVQQDKVPHSVAKFDFDDVEFSFVRLEMQLIPTTFWNYEQYFHQGEIHLLLHGATNLVHNYYSVKQSICF